MAQLQITLHAIYIIMYTFTAQFATDVTALRLGEKLEDAGVAVSRLVVCSGRVAATAALQLRLRLRYVSFDFSANARDDPERSFAEGNGTQAKSQAR